MIAISGGIWGGDGLNHVFYCLSKWTKCGWIGYTLFYFLKTTVCTGSGSTTESSAVFPATAAVGTSPPTVPGSEDEVGGHSMKCHIVC